MPDFEKHSSGVARAGLATGIVGSALGVLNTAGGLGGLLGGKRGDDNHGYHHNYHPAYHPDYVHKQDRDREEKQREKLVCKETLAMSQTIAMQNAEIERMKAEKHMAALVEHEVAPVRKQVAEQAMEIAMLKRDVAEIPRWAECNFVPQEKGYMDGRRVNFHGTHPLLGINGGDERFPKRERCGCHCEHVAG